jgi:hypothetical protein
MAQTVSRRRRPGLYSTLVHMAFVVDTVAREGFLPGVLWLSPISIIPSHVSTNQYHLATDSVVT